MCSLATWVVPGKGQKHLIDMMKLSWSVSSQSSGTGKCTLCIQDTAGVHRIRLSKTRHAQQGRGTKQAALDRDSTVLVCQLHPTWWGGRATLALIHLLNLSRAGSKHHTLINRLSWLAKPHKEVLFTLHHWVDELVYSANGQGGGGPRDQMAKWIPSQEWLVG